MCDLFANCNNIHNLCIQCCPDIEVGVGTKEHNEKFFVNFDKEQFSVLKNSHYFDKKETKDNSEQLKEIGPIPEESLFLLLMEKEREYMGIGNLIWQWEVELFIIQKKFLRDI